MSKQDRRVIIVTGAAQGFGRAIAEKMIEAGDFVAIVDLNAERAAQTAAELGEQAKAYPCDVSNGEQVAKMVQAVLDDHGRIDGLVNNAGIDRAAHILDISEEEWDRVLGVNLKSLFLCSKAVLPTMIAQSKGSIVNIASITGRQGALKAGIHYASSKAGIFGFTRSLARLVAKDGIRVNSVAPGTAETQLVRDNLTEEEREKLGKAVPMGRLGRPDEVAMAVRFLLSDEASYITGATLDVNGGAWMG